MPPKSRSSRKNKSHNKTIKSSSKSSGSSSKDLTEHIANAIERVIHAEPKTEEEKLAIKSFEDTMSAIKDVNGELYESFDFASDYITKRLRHKMSILHLVVNKFDIL